MPVRSRNNPAICGMQRDNEISGMRTRTRHSLEGNATFNGEITVSNGRSADANISRMQAADYWRRERGPKSRSNNPYLKHRCDDLHVHKGARGQPGFGGGGCQPLHQPDLAWRVARARFPRRPCGRGRVPLARRRLGQRRGRQAGRYSRLGSARGTGRCSCGSRGGCGRRKGCARHGGPPRRRPLLEALQHAGGRFSEQPVGVLAQLSTRAHCVPRRTCHQSLLTPMEARPATTNAAFKSLSQTVRQVP